MLIDVTEQFAIFGYDICSTITMILEDHVRVVMTAFERGLSIQRKSKMVLSEF